MIRTERNVELQWREEKGQIILSLRIIGLNLGPVIGVSAQLLDNKKGKVLQSLQQGGAVAPVSTGWTDPERLELARHIASQIKRPDRLELDELENELTNAIKAVTA